MKPSDNDPWHYLTPEADGWAVWRGAQRLHIAPTLAEAAELLPEGCRFEFAVPCHPLILERLALPGTERDELAGMVQLQWEKALPYPPEEITGGFTVIESSEKEVVVWSAAAARETLQGFGEIWSKANHWPKRVVPYVCHVSAACPAEETVLVIYGEQGHWVLAVVEKQRPGWVHVMSATDAPAFAAEFPSLMLTATMDGVPNGFARVLLSPELMSCESFLLSEGHAPVEALPLVTPGAAGEMNLVSSDWLSAAGLHRRGQAWRQRAMAAAALYLILVALAGLDLFIQHRRASGLEAEMNAQRPALALLQSREARFDSLAAAIDSRRYTIELLYLLQRCLPADSVRFTEFDQMPQEWRVVGEAPNAGLAIDYLSRLKRDPDLSASEISADPPRLLANERAQFQVIGKP
jgi:hypothetical protein